MGLFLLLRLWTGLDFTPEVDALFEEALITVTSGAFPFSAAVAFAGVWEDEAFVDPVGVSSTVDASTGVSIA